METGSQNGGKNEEVGELRVALKDFLDFMKL